MVQLSFAAALALATAVLATPKPITPDPSGAKNVGNGQGLQFITGQCASTADCGQQAVQSCCAFIAADPSTGICSGIAVASANGKAGCGFGDGGSAPPAAAPAAAAPPAAAAGQANAAPAAQAATGQAGSAQCTVSQGLAGSQNAGKGAQAQFITGQCLSAADCFSGCCVAQAGGVSQCKARLVTEQAGLSCDFACAA